MIAAVSLRWLYLIFQQVFGLVLLMGRASAAEDVEVLVSRHGISVAPSHESTTSAWTGYDRAVVTAVIRRLPWRCVAIAWSPPTRSCAGIAASCAKGGPTRTSPDDPDRRQPRRTGRGGWRETTRAVSVSTVAPTASATDGFEAKPIPLICGCGMRHGSCGGGRRHRCGSIAVSFLLDTPTV
jgi:hypothetical protein